MAQMAVMDIVRSVKNMPLLDCGSEKGSATATNAILDNSPLYTPMFTPHGI